MRNWMILSLAPCKTFLESFNSLSTCDKLFCSISQNFRFKKKKVSIFLRPLSLLDANGTQHLP